MIPEVMLDKVFKILLELDSVVDDVPYVKDERPMVIYKDAPALPLDGGQNRVTKIVQSGDELKDKDEVQSEAEKSEIVICQSCKTPIKYGDTPESGMGYIKCPNCGKPIDQTGKVLGGDKDEELVQNEDDEFSEGDEYVQEILPSPSIYRDVSPEADEEYERELPHSLAGGIEFYGIKIVEQEDPGTPPAPEAGMTAPGGGDPDPSEPDMTSEEQFSDPGKVFELKKIFSRLLALENYLSTATDEKVLVLRDYVSKAIELFRVVIDNLPSFKEKINDIIVLFYEFIERVYEILKFYYKPKEEKETGGIIKTEAVSISKSSKDLPRDLLKFLLDPNIPRPVDSIKDIDKHHKYMMKTIKGDMKHAETDTGNYHTYYEIMKKSFDMVKELSLYCIYDYINGDTAWYSFIDHKVYDYDHEYGAFNKVLSPEEAKKLRVEVLYKEWIKEVKSGARYDNSVNH